MARVTVEDCIDVVDNQFELVLFAAQLAREISLGAHRTTESAPQTTKKRRYEEKVAVQALRRIAARDDAPERLEQAVISSMTRIPFGQSMSNLISAETAKREAEKANGEENGVKPVSAVHAASSLGAQPKMFEDTEEDDESSEAHHPDSEPSVVGEG